MTQPDTSGPDEPLPADDGGVDPAGRPEQPPMDDDASGLPDEEADALGDFA